METLRTVPKAKPAAHAALVQLETQDPEKMEKDAELVERHVNEQGGEPTTDVRGAALRLAEATVLHLEEALSMPHRSAVKAWDNYT